MTTDLQNLLDQIHQIEKHTRSGPWELHPVNDSQMYAAFVVGPEADTLEPEIAAVVSGFDGQFIALARTALPQLAKTVKSVLEFLEHRAHHSKALDPTGEFWAILDAYDRAIRQVITDAMNGADDD